jgi:hypothetical protein
MQARNRATATKAIPPLSPAPKSPSRIVAPVWVPAQYDRVSGREQEWCAAAPGEPRAAAFTGANETERVPRSDAWVYYQFALASVGPNRCNASDLPFRP